MFYQIITTLTNSDTFKHEKYQTINFFISNTFLIDFNRSSHVTMRNTMERYLRYKIKRKKIIIVEKIKK